ncbi:SAF domain-containing protein [Microbacterium aurantiacum]|uniref:SAF domain-containing protein n=1 Tax=Microbacterium aurantiacum TaxID=162393 RepID=UPI004036BA5B
MTAAVSSRPTRASARPDLRLILGIILVLASILGVWFTVQAARTTAPAYVATRTIVPGEAVTADVVRSVEVSLGGLSESYLSTADVESGLVATRTIEVGELVPVAAVGSADAARTTRVVVRSAVDVPASVAAGTVVEVWAAPQRERGVYDAPRILVADATVVSVARDESMIGGGAAQLELVIPRSDVAAALTAMSDQSALSVVPAAGAGS